MPDSHIVDAHSEISVPRYADSSHLSVLAMLPVSAEARRSHFQFQV